MEYFYGQDRVQIRFIFRSGSAESIVFVYLCLLICCHLSNESDVDTLEVQYTVDRGSNGKLQFQQTTLFNGHVIFTCNSQTLRDQPQQDWVTEAFTQEELDERHEQCKSQGYEQFPWFEKIDETITDTAGVLQRRRGCMISSSGEFPFDEWGVNGEDFLTFDPSALKWTAQTNEANPLAAEWNGQDIRSRAYRNFGHTLCNKTHILTTKQAARLRNVTHTGVELLIFGKPIPEGTYLQCHVTGSSLSGVSIQLTEDGVPLDHGVHHTGPRPNGDGTVQMRVLVKTTIDNSRTYRCEVHSETFNKSVVFDDPSLHQSTEIGAVPSVIVTVAASMVFLGIMIGFQTFLHEKETAVVVAAVGAMARPIRSSN